MCFFLVTQCHILYLYLYYWSINTFYKYLFYLSICKNRNQGSWPAHSAYHSKLRNIQIKFACKFLWNILYFYLGGIIFIWDFHGLGQKFLHAVQVCLLLHHYSFSKPFARLLFTPIETAYSCWTTKIRFISVLISPLKKRWVYFHDIKLFLTQSTW